MQSMGTTMRVRPKSSDSDLPDERLYFVCELVRNLCSSGERDRGRSSGKDIFDLKFVLVETFLLLFSSITYGMAMIAMNKGKVGGVNTWLFLTFLFGLGFVAMEIYEFHHLIAEGFGPDRSAFLSSFFALVGTHGLHVTSGLIWIIVMMIQVSKFGLTATNKTRLMCLSLFWHFLDVVWICVFTVVYLLGVM